MNCGNISLKLLCILICHVIEVCLRDCWFCFQEFVAKNAPTYIDHTSSYLLCNQLKYNCHKPRLHIPFKALLKPVYVKPFSCKRTKAISKLIWLNHIPRWFETGLKRFRHVCKQLKRFKLLYKIQALTLPSLLFSKRSPSPIANKPRSSHAGMSPTASKHER